MTSATRTQRRVAALAAGTILAMLIALFPALAPTPALAATAANLGVSLGGGAQGSTTATLRQGTVAARSIVLVRQWRQDALNDSRIKFKDSSDGKYYTVAQYLTRKGMTQSAYLNPSWDTNLERIAVQRALESTYLCDHVRYGDGTSSSTAAVNGVSTAYEVLAYAGTSMDTAFGFWMGEKADYIKYVSGDSSITFADIGHYQNIIMPASTAMGFGMVNGMAAGETSTTAPKSTSQLGLNGSYDLKIAVPTAKLKAGTLSGVADRMAIGRSAQPSVTMTGASLSANTFTGVTPTAVTVPTSSVSTSNAAVMTASGNTLKAVGTGTVTITAKDAGGTSRSKSVTVQRFSDINPGHAHEADINWVYDNGIAQGYANGDGTWRYEGMTPVYRQDMAAFLHRLAKLAGKDTGVTLDTSFTDVTDSTPHADDIRWLAGAAITEGYKQSDGTVKYQGMFPVYRQDMAAFIHRLDTRLDK
ncbi:MAG: CAP domain-containing protein [Bifidobacterium sp.]|nr:CAP domain-containing protein [Bifidobacterium sp.]